MRDQGAAFEEVDLSKGITAAELGKLIGKRDYVAFLNPRNELYRERGMREKPPSREEALKLMAANPNLIKRPILVKGRSLLLGFEQDEWNRV